MTALTRLTLTLTTCAALTGCISYETHRESKGVGLPDPAMLDTVELGETTSAWLREQLGDPDSVRVPSESVRVWQYENVDQASTRLRAFPLFTFSLSDEVRTVYHFAIENDRIVKYWKDHDGARFGAD